MGTWWLIFFQSLAMVGIAEMGDKTQFVVIAMAKKYKVYQIVIGILISTILNNLIAVIFGSVISSLIPPVVIQFISGFLFLIFAVTSLKDSSEEESEINLKLGPVLIVGLTFFLAEFGDKTQLATANLAATAGSNFLAIAVLLGATAGMMAANGIGLFVGVKLASSIPDYIFKWLSAVIFAFFALTTLYTPYTDVLGATNGIISLVITAIIGLSIGYVIYKKQRRKSK